ncbi:MAG: UvrD-helicase domain-containing protein [Clostridia bacterium]|nr:UvrD-helicase domain-containing protein [Clostridia bacterium]
MNWTEDQLRVINAPARHMICSAAAGSGKTAVLVERIIRYLKQGTEPQSFLIITFTNAAASEMKEKIRDRLMLEQDQAYLRQALENLDLMQISTIHAFCQKLLEEYFHKVNIDPLFSICDASRRKNFFHEAFMETCNTLDAENEPAFLCLKQRYEGKKLEKLMENLDSFLMSLPDPMEWLESALRIPNNLSENHPWNDTIRMMREEKIRQAKIYLQRMERLLEEPEALESYKKTFQEDQKLFHVKQEAWQTGNGPAENEKWKNLFTPRGLTPLEMDWKDRYQDLRNQWKNVVSEADALQIREEGVIINEWKNIQETLQAIAVFYRKLSELFQEKKRSRALADFQDLEQYAISILKDDHLRKEIRGRWRQIFVDECQDISQVQYQLIQYLHGEENHLFMVGDVKQSIYRFRLADPSLFMDEIKECNAGTDPEKECIYLQTNFRSRPEILETSNMVFRKIMRQDATELNYSPQDELICGRETQGTIPVMVDVLSGKENFESGLQLTADYLADQIEKLRQTEYTGKNRKYRYRDCVILMPGVATEGPKLKEYLEKKHIPVFFDGAGDYYHQPEVQQFKLLLEWIENPYQDLALVSVLQHSPFSFSDERLSQIRLRMMEKDSCFFEAFEKTCGENSPLGEACRRVKEKHARWQELADELQLGDLIWLLLQDSGLYWVAAVETDGEIRQANLRMLAQEAARAEQNGILTLGAFLNYLSEQQQYGDQQNATLLGDADDLVRIMTIHKSKGLQFPVVFCCGMDQNMFKPQEDLIRCDSKMGLCVQYKEPAHRIARKTLLTQVFQWKKNREELAEKVRLLYVAMTRAQERLFMVTTQETNALWSMPESAERILGARTFTDLWMPVIRDHAGENLSTGNSQAENPYNIRVLEYFPQKTVEKESDIHSLRNWLETTLSAPVVDELWKETENNGSETLVKKSVTALIRETMHTLEDQEEENPQIKRTPEAFARRLEREELPDLPAFMRETKLLTGAWRGTLTHRILSAIDLKALLEGQNPAEVLADLKEKMVRDHRMTAQEVEQIRDEQVLSFLSSPMGQRMIASPEVHREWNFNLKVERAGSSMILQGVIDCAFREGKEWVILDYKTDYIRDPESFVEIYRPQIEWYAEAISRLTNQKVKEASLYSLSLGRLFPIIRAEN